MNGGTCSVGAILWGMTFIAWAQPESKAATELVTSPVDTQASLGLGVAVYEYTQYAGNSGSQAFVVPWLVFDNSVFFLDTALLQGGAVLWRSGTVKLDFLAQARLGFEPENDPLLAGLDGRGNAAEVGPRLQWTLASWTLMGGYYTGVGGDAEGQAAGLTLSRAHRWGRIDLLPMIDLRWESRALVHHLYGIDQQESTSQRPTYQGRATLTTNLGSPLPSSKRAAIACWPVWPTKSQGQGYATVLIVRRKDGYVGVLGILWHF